MKKANAVAVGAPTPLLVDIKQAAAMLSTTVWQIRELGWSKKLPYIKLGRKWLFTPASLEAFVRKQAGA